jgi:hypothetical protein
MEIKLFTNENAKKYITKVVKNHVQIEQQFYHNASHWLKESNNVKCYALCKKDEVINIILLSQCDHDPEEKHLIPYILDFIYTFSKHRRNNFAYRMLLYIKSKEQITTFCSNDESEKLFRKAEYIYSGLDPLKNKLPIFRFP